MQKEDTRIAPLQVEQGQYPSQATVWREFALYIDHHIKNTMGFAKRWRDWRNDRFNIWDEFIRDMIQRGFYVELIGVNPQIRSAVKLYGDAIVSREIHRQTDRQSDNGLRIVVPEDNVDNEYNNAADEEENDEEGT